MSECAYQIAEWTGGTAESPCGKCGRVTGRLPMPEDTAKVYDALFPAVLEWSEDEDCDINELMRDVAETAAAALRPSEGEPRA